MCKELDEFKSVVGSLEGKRSADEKDKLIQKIEVVENADPSSERKGDVSKYSMGWDRGYKRATDIFKKSGGNINSKIKEVEKEIKESIKKATVGEYNAFNLGWVGGMEEALSVFKGVA